MGNWEHDWIPDLATNEAIIISFSSAFSMCVHWWSLLSCQSCCFKVDIYDMLWTKLLLAGWNLVAPVFQLPHVLQFE